MVQGPRGIDDAPETKRQFRSIAQWAWVVAFLGLAIPAIARFATSTLDGATVVAALLGGVLLSVVVVGGLVLFLMLPVYVRNRALRREYPGRLLFTVSEVDRRHKVFTDREAAQGGRSARLFSVTITVGGDRLDVWTGGANPTRWGSLPADLVTSVHGIQTWAGMRGARGVRLELIDHPPIELVPMGRLATPLSAKKRDALVGELTDWLGNQGQALPPLTHN
ncbi:hypothetical protein [Microcella sp.]|uniref:hypothetical protein n=1 Tax=Microcella sp. TaxID=1913979 RepID=UPI003F70F54F